MERFKIQAQFWAYLFGDVPSPFWAQYHPLKSQEFCECLCVYVRAFSPLFKVFRPPHVNSPSCLWPWTSPRYTVSYTASSSEASRQSPRSNNTVSVSNNHLWVRQSSPAKILGSGNKCRPAHQRAWWEAKTTPCRVFHTQAALKRETDALPYLQRTARQ